MFEDFHQISCKIDFEENSSNFFYECSIVKFCKAFVLKKLKLGQELTKNVRANNSVVKKCRNLPGGCRFVSILCQYYSTPGSSWPDFGDTNK